MNTYSLHFKWTVSRGRETYGYNICTLFVDGVKVASCDGGGYDMQGTCLANWMKVAFQDRLQKLFAKEMKAVKPSDWKGEEGKKYLYVDLRNRFYGFHVTADKEGEKLHITADGGCGFSSIEKALNAIGITLKWNKESDRSKNDTWYTAIDSGIQPKEIHDMYRTVRKA